MAEEAHLRFPLLVFLSWQFLQPQSEYRERIFLYSIAEQGHGWDCDISILEVNLKQMDTTKVKHESIIQHGVCTFDSERISLFHGDRKWSDMEIHNG